MLFLGRRGNVLILCSCPLESRPARIYKCKTFDDCNAVPWSPGGIPQRQKAHCVPTGVEINRPFTVYNYKCYKEIEFMKKMPVCIRGSGLKWIASRVRSLRGRFAFRIIQKWLEELDNAVWWSCGAEWSHSVRVQPVKEKYDRSQITGLSSSVVWSGQLVYSGQCWACGPSKEIRRKFISRFLFDIHRKWRSTQRRKSILQSIQNVLWVFFTLQLLPKNTWKSNIKLIFHKQVSKSCIPTLQHCYIFLFIFLFGPFGCKSSLEHVFNTHLWEFLLLLLLPWFLVASPRPLTQCSFMCEDPHKADQAETLHSFLHTILSVLPPPSLLFLLPSIPHQKKMEMGSYGGNYFWEPGLSSTHPSTTAATTFTSPSLHNLSPTQQPTHHQ